MNEWIIKNRKKNNKKTLEFRSFTSLDYRTCTTNIYAAIIDFLPIKHLNSHVRINFLKLF